MVNKIKSQQKHLIREQLQKTVDRLKPICSIQRPVRGWLRRVREALGMSSKQFAECLGVSGPRITSLESKRGLNPTCQIRPGKFFM